MTVRGVKERREILRRSIFDVRRLEPLILGPRGDQHRIREGEAPRERFDTGLTREVAAARLEAALQVNRFVLASSLHVYGNAVDAPASETTLPLPVSPYGVARLASEHLLTAYATNYRVPTVALRLGSLYGPRQRPDQIFHRLIRTSLEGVGLDILGDGHQKRDFLHVDDAVEACVAVLRKGGSGGVYNIASGEPRSIREAIEILKTKIDIAPERIRWQSATRGDLVGSWADVTKAREELGWQPRTELSTGLDSEIAWIREQVAETAG